jgi:hypothetical protein
MECKIDQNLKLCNCSYEPCSRKGTCCDCLSYHLRARELPACCFQMMLNEPTIALLNILPVWSLIKKYKSFTRTDPLDQPVPSWWDWTRNRERS